MNEHASGVCEVNCPCTDWTQSADQLAVLRQLDSAHNLPWTAQI